MSRKYGAAPALVTVVLLAGCGSGGSHQTHSVSRSNAAHTVQQTSDAPVVMPVAKRSPRPRPDHRPSHSRPRAHASARPAGSHSSSRTSGHPQQSSHPPTASTPATAAPAAPRAPSFAKSYAELAAQMTLSAQAIGSALRNGASRTHAQNLSAFRILTTRWQSQLQRLDALTPPSGLDGAFGSLRRAGARIESDLKAIANAIAGRNSTAGGKAVARIMADILAARSADSAIKHRLGIA